VTVVIEAHNAVTPANDSLKQCFGSKFVIHARCILSRSVVNHFDCVADLELAAHNQPHSVNAFAAASRSTLCSSCFCMVRRLPADRAGGAECAPKANWDG
jgi:hypothetical protein